MTSTEILRDQLIKQLRIAQPTSPDESILSRANALIETRAYTFDGERIVPIGSRAQMAQAALIAPTVARQITKEHIATVTASSSPETAGYDRAAARLAAMGINIDDALAGDSEAGREFYGIDLTTFDPKGAA